MKKVFDPSVYFIADPECCAGRDVADVVMAAVRGGASMVQYRDKSVDLRKIAAKASQLAELLLDSPVPLILNDYIDIAVAASADGVHLGQDDESPARARQKLGFDAIIGVTAFTQEQIKAVDVTVVDYIGTGPVYETKTDKGKPVLGVERFSELIKLTKAPAVGIGGVTPENAGAILEAGAAGVAMMRSIGEQWDVEEAARAFCMKEGKQAHG